MGRRVNQDSLNKIKELLTRERFRKNFLLGKVVHAWQKRHAKGQDLPIFQKNDFFICICEKSL